MIFPTPIGISHSPEDFGITSHCVEVLNEHIETGNQEGLLEREATRTTFFKPHNIITDKRFDRLNSWVVKEVAEYATRLGYCADQMSARGWVTKSLRGDFHEVHNHSESHISCVYYVEAEEEDANIVIHKSGMPSMFPIPLNDGSGLVTATRYNYAPSKGKLLLFSSDTMHSVDHKTTEGTRISIAYNFTLSRHGDS